MLQELFENFYVGILLRFTVSTNSQNSENSFKYELAIHPGKKFQESHQCVKCFCVENEVTGQNVISEFQFPQQVVESWSQ